MRVLVVEDEPDLARALRRTLIEEGYACDVAHDGESGLVMALSDTYDALVLDLMLPGLNGLDLLRRLRTRGLGVPVLLLTARDAPGDKVRGLDTGADDYLTKPFALEELLARLRALIRRAAREPAPVLTLGEIAIDTAARRVTRAGAPVTLTAKEYAVLELLAFRRGQVVTRTFLYDHLYGGDEETLSNVVDVYVANLRRKLGRHVIATRRGEGYLVP